MKNLSIRLKIYIILIVISFGILCSAGVVIFSLNKAEDDADIVNALGRQRMLTQAMGKAVLGYISNKNELNIFKKEIDLLNRYITSMRFVYTEDVVGSAEKAGIKTPVNPAQEPHPAIPFPATFTHLVNEMLGEDNKLENNVVIEVISESPINPDKAYKSKLDKKAGDFLKKNKKDNIFLGTEEEDEKLFLLFYTADTATTADCVSCHAKMKGTDFQIGDMLGIRKFKILFSNDIAIGQARLSPGLGEYEKAKIVFAKTLTAMKSGGAYPLDLKLENHKTITRIKDKSAQAKIGEIEDRFSQLTKTVDSLLSTTVGSDHFFQLSQNLLVQSNELRELSDELVSIYTDISDKNQQNILLAVALSGAAILFAILGIAFFISGSFSTPLKNLTDTAAEIGRGNLETIIEVKSKDEIGQLAASFNKMTEDLKNTTVSKNHVDSIINCVTNSIIVLSSDLTIKSVNNATCNLLGCNEDELSGKSIKAVFAEEESLKETFLDTLNKKGFIKNIDMNWLAKDGHKIPVLFSGSRMLDNDGKTQGFVCVAQDIAEIRQADKKQTSLYNELKNSKKTLENTHSELKANIEELETFKEITLGREERIIQLKNKIKELEDDK